MQPYKKFAKVAIENIAYSADKLFDYGIPENTAESVQKGVRVLVPFGTGDRKKLGVVFEICSECDFSNVKSLSAVLDKAPLLSGEMLELASWLKEHTFCTYFEAAKVMLPSGINLKLSMFYSVVIGSKDYNDMDLTESEFDIAEAIRRNGEIQRDELLKSFGSNSGKIIDSLEKKGVIVRSERINQKVGNASVKAARLSENKKLVEDYLKKATTKQKSVIEFLTRYGSASVKEITYFTGVGEGVVAALCRNGVAEYFRSEIYRDPYSNSDKIIDYKDIVLTVEQQYAYEGMKKHIDNRRACVSLLFGVTGSGKTQVFLKLIDRVLEQGRRVIVMVPEIALTPQTISIFHRRYGGSVAVFHSGLSLGERFDEWKRVKNGNADIVVGTRSAVFAPMDNIGLVIMDEEHEQTYKSEKNPKFHARDVARFRCAKQNALLVLASATPSVESYAAAESGRFELYTLNSRYGGASLPKVITSDISNELVSGNRNAIGKFLSDELLRVFEAGQQSILLLNRRGYNTYALCMSCKTVVTCPHCSISLTYHSANRRFMCHYCGYSASIDKCPECGSSKLRMSGFGTQKIEEELKAIIPQAKVLRLDADTTMTRSSFEKKLKKFSNKEYDILLGTQMVAKGLDFENVTLVGVVSIDSSLFDADYRANERTFSLLTQVLGRSGRGRHSGKAVIQTCYPENPIIQMSAAQDYISFYRNEIVIRKLLTYPPYCDLCVVSFISKKHEKAEESSKMFLDLLIEENKNDEIKMIVLGPAPARVVKISDKYRYNLIIKCKNNNRFRNMISKLLCSFKRISAYKDVVLSVDVNPYSMV